MISTDTEIFNFATVTFGLFVLVGLAVLYLLPTLIAFKRGAGNANWAAAINILLGLTVIGWLIAFVMALGARSARGDVLRLERDDEARRQAIFSPDPARARPDANPPVQDRVAASHPEPGATVAPPASPQIAPIVANASRERSISGSDPSTAPLPDLHSDPNDPRLVWLAERGEAARQGIKELRAKWKVYPPTDADVMRLAFLNRVYDLTVQIYSIRSRSGGLRQSAQLASLESELDLYFGATDRVTAAQRTDRTDQTPPMDEDAVARQPIR